MGRRSNSTHRKLPEGVPAQNPSWLNAVHIAALTSAILGMLLYADSIGFGFVYDDVSIIEQDERLRDANYISKVWWETWWPEGSAKQESRPLTSLSFWAHVQTTGLEPVPMHVVNILLFGLLTYLVAVLAARWLASPWVAWPVGLMFAAHPIHVETVANLVGRAEALAAVFSVAALLGWHCWRRNMTWWRGIAIGSLVLLAGQGKETGYLTAAAILLGEIAERRCEGTSIFRRPWLIPLCTSIGMVALYAIIQRAIVVSKRGEISADVHPMVNPLMTADVGERLVTPLKLTGKAAQLLLLPYDQSSDYSPQLLMPTSNLLEPLVLLGIITVCIWTFLTWYAWRMRERVLGPLLALPVAWIIPSNLLILIGTIFGERLLMLLSILVPIVMLGLVDHASRLSAESRRYLTLACWTVVVSMSAYVPVMALHASVDETFSHVPFIYAKLFICLLLGIVVASLASISTGRKLYCATVAIVVSGYACTIYTYIPTWKSFEAHTLSTAARHPTNGRYRAELAYLLVERVVDRQSTDDDWYLTTAREHADEALKLWPTQPIPFVVLACVAKHRGNLEEAKRQLNYLKNLGHSLTRYSRVMTHFGLIEDPKQLRKRVKQLERELQSDPDNIELIRRLARLYIDLGEPKRAVQIFEPLVGTDISQVQDAAIIQQYVNILIDAGEAELLLPVYRHWIELEPNRAVTRVNAAQIMLEIGLGNKKEIKQWIDEALRLQKDLPGAWRALAQWYEKDDQLSKAADAIDQAVRSLNLNDPRRPSYLQEQKRLRKEAGR